MLVNKRFANSRFSAFMDDTANEVDTGYSNSQSLHLCLLIMLVPIGELGLSKLITLLCPRYSAHSSFDDESV